MKFPQLLKILALALVIGTSALTQHTFGQAQGVRDNESVPVGSLVIPMDNTNQPGNSVAFNLRAYGLANRLLQKNIPIKWAILYNKGVPPGINGATVVTTKESVDFSAFVTRYSGSGPVAGGNVQTLRNFNGGPFIVAPEYAALAKTEIDDFNTLGFAVTVYEVKTVATADIRYTITHKPKIAVGPDGGNFGTGVYQTLFLEAGIPNTNFTSVPDNLVTSGSCFTLATQAHSTDPTFVNNYRNFVTNGGNLILECASINTFENNGNLNGPGHFQVSNNYGVFGTNDNTDVSGSALLFPNAYMPFNQFDGALNGDQDGAITDYGNPSTDSFIHGNLIAAQNNKSGTNGHSYVATVSDLTPTTPGGHVFELGGHDYNRNGGNATLGNINGKRMVLNTIFVPVTRPCSDLQVPSVEGYKSVVLTGDVNGNHAIDPGDTITWTVTYINRGQAPASNFQITDVIPVSPAPGFHITATGAQTVTTSAGTTAAKNPFYTGTSAGDTNLLASGAVLPPNGKITITIPTTLGSNTSGTWNNQTFATGVNVGGSVPSDDIDDTQTIVYPAPGGNIHPTGSIPQTILPSIDPTVVSNFRTTAADASVNGRVITAGGTSISRAQITVVDAQTSEAKVGMTNLFGYFTVEGLEVGKLYIISVSHPSYQFTQSSQSFVLNDNVSGLVFVATTGGKGTRTTPAGPARQIPGLTGNATPSAPSVPGKGTVISTRAPF